MTVSAQAKQTLASLKGIRATLDMFALHGENGEAKTVYRRNSERVGQVIDDLEQRISVLEFAEPQYKGF
ncbi:MAG: hypothetical protein VR69_00495 [Peptococcaceae bacterium BRH_c4b]|nr:MAG: hypothetical protein VR69_00495 [Peptococcaceae bacterium BRH_c4b]